jgi:hypothetical protein
MARQDVISNGINLYNSECAAMTLGYIGTTSAFIKISNVKEEQKGKKPKKGVEMFDYKGSGSVMMTLSLDRLVTLKNYLDKIIKKEIPYITFSSRYQDDLKEITFGVDLYETDSKNQLQIIVTVLDRDNPDKENPKSEHIFFMEKQLIEVADKKIKTDSLASILRAWLDESIKNCLGSYTHAAKVASNSSNYNSDKPQRSYNKDEESSGGGKKFPRRSQKQEVQDNDETDFDPGEEF